MVLLGGGVSCPCTFQKTKVKIPKFHSKEKDIVMGNQPDMGTAHTASVSHTPGKPARTAL